MTDIFALSDRLTDELAALDPILATETGVEGHDNRWTDLSPEGIKQSRIFWEQALAEAEACTDDDARTHLAKEVLIGECRRHLVEITEGRFRSDLNSLASPWQAIRDVFDLAPSDSSKAWRDIEQRLTTIDQPLSGYQASLQSGLDASETVARRQVLTAIDQGKAVAGDDSSLNELLERFDETHVGPGNSERRADIELAVQSAKNRFSLMATWLEDVYLPQAQESDAVGRERYVKAAESFLGDTLDADATYRWGWDEVNRLTRRLEELCTEINPGLDVDGVIAELRTNPAHSATDVDSYIEFMQARQHQALDQLSEIHFDVDERYANVEVKVASAGGALAPYYVPPSEDFSRAGCVWFPISEQDEFPYFLDVTTNYHEGFPGHHLQCGWQASMGDDLSRFHKQMVWYPGAGEGWALYAEHLMDELGFLEEPAYKVGLVLSQLLRACRIVIDIGSHLELDIPDDACFGAGQTWSYELAVQMLTERCYQTPEVSVSEIVRYLGWPGQAISYKLGEQAILDLREQRSKQDDFDLKTFHADLLSVGSIRLDLMRSIIG